MASNATLTSLAMLKVNIDRGRDYFEYLRPFILQVLIDHRPSPVTDLVVKDHLLNDFGLEIPLRAVQLVLRRIVKTRVLEKSRGVYNIIGKLPDPSISAKKPEAYRHINAVISGLLNFRQDDLSPISTEDEAIEALCMFLSEFSIPCIKAYLRGTAIPDIAKKQPNKMVFLSQYILHLQKNDPERFASFIVIVQGHMLANALLCPDLQDVPKSYRGVIFYFDTPLLVRFLCLEGEMKFQAVKELISLLQDLGAKVAVFGHTREELNRVVRGAAHNIDSPDGRGAIVMEARRNKTTKSDLFLLAGRIDELLKNASIEIISTPKYIADFQIDEMIFDNLLEDEIFYYNPRAKQYDINSVRSIYVIRSGKTPLSLEKCKAVLVTSNSDYAKVAYEYGQNHEETLEVSSVITDFSLANVAWLKAPVAASSLPIMEFLAYAYAANQPSKGLLDKLVTEADKLKKNGTITYRDHQLLRSNVLAQDELMNLTLGEEDALTPETVLETLERVEGEITKEVKEELEEEESAHKITRDKMETARNERDILKKRIYWKCQKRAELCAKGVFAMITMLLIVGFFVGLGMGFETPVVVGVLLSLCFLLFGIASLISLILGVSILKLCENIEERCLIYSLKKESEKTGIDLNG